MLECCRQEVTDVEAKPVTYFGLALRKNHRALKNQSFI
jgi:hypothetical protein